MFTSFPQTRCKLLSCATTIFKDKNKLLCTKQVYIYKSVTTIAIYRTKILLKLQITLGINILNNSKFASLQETVSGKYLTNSFSLTLTLTLTITLKNILVLCTAKSVSQTVEVFCSLHNVPQVREFDNYLVQYQRYLGK